MSAPEGVDDGCEFETCRKLEKYLLMRLSVANKDNNGILRSTGVRQGRANRQLHARGRGAEHTEGILVTCDHATREGTGGALA